VGTRVGASDAASGGGGRGGVAVGMVVLFAGRERAVRPTALFAASQARGRALTNGRSLGQQKSSHQTVSRWGGSSRRLAVGCTRGVRAAWKFEMPGAKALTSQAFWKLHRQEFQGGGARQIVGANTHCEGLGMCEAIVEERLPHHTCDRKASRVTDCEDRTPTLLRTAIIWSAAPR